MDSSLISTYDNSLVSVLLPVFNGGQYLLPAVKSIIQQSYKNWELLILDDGSDDGAVDRLSEVIQDSRVLIFKDGLNLGLTYRLNQGVLLSKGQYIARMDADDLSFPDRFHLQVEHLINHPSVDLVGSRAIVFRDPGPMIVGLLPYRESHLELISSPWRFIPLPHPTWMGKKEWFLKHQYAVPEVQRAEDQDLLLRASANSIYYCLPDTLLAYRQSKFNFEKVRIARYSLMQVQLVYFFKRKQYFNLMASCAITLIKLVIDFISSVRGCEKLFFARMASPVPASVEIRFNQIYKELMSD